MEHISEKLIGHSWTKTPREYFSWIMSKSSFSSDFRGRREHELFNGPTGSDRKLCFYQIHEHLILKTQRRRVRYVDNSIKRKFIHPCSQTFADFPPFLAFVSIYIRALIRTPRQIDLQIICLLGSSSRSAERFGPRAGQRGRGRILAPKRVLYFSQHVPDCLMPDGMTLLYRHC